MKIPKLIILDMDGLMFDSESISKHFYLQVALEHGYVVPEELYNSMLGGNKERNKSILINHFGESYPYKQISEETGKLCLDYYNHHGIGIKKGLIELLEYAKMKHIYVAVASSSNKDVIERNLKMANVNHYIDYVISGDQVEHSKPHPEIFLNSCVYFGILPQEAIVLEDSKNGILAARNANIPVICVPDLIYHSRDIFNLTYATVPSLDCVIDLIEKQVKLAIFDMDGLMFDTERQCIQPLIKANRDFGYEMSEEIAYQLIGTSGANAKEILLNHFGKDYPYQQIDEEFEQLLLNTIKTEGLSIKEGLIKLLNHLQDLNIKCVVAASSHTDLIRTYLNLSNITQYFDKIIGGDQVAFTKPNPDLFIKACEVCHVKQEDAIVFEDSKNGILAANEAHIPVICIPDIIMHDQSILNKTLAFMPSLSRVHLNSKNGGKQ